MKLTIKRAVIMYAVSCFAGASCEFLVGWILRYALGRFIWIYPDSPLQTTSLIVIPLWGVAGLMFYGIEWAINKQNPPLQLTGKVECPNSTL